MKSAILLPIIVVLVVAAAVAVVEITGVNPFVKPSEGGVMETAITELLDTKTFKMNGEVAVDIESSVGGMGEGSLSVLPGVSSVKMFVNISSDIDQRKEGSLKTSSNINLGVDAEGMSMAGIIEAITIGSGLYVKLVSAPPVLTAFLGDIEDIKNQWIGIDLGDMKEQYANQAGVELDEEELDEQLNDLMNEMKELLRNKTIFDITRELGEEELNEISTEHYFVSADKKAVKEVILEYIELTKKYVSPEQKAEYERNLENAMIEFPSKFDEFWASIDGIEFDIWVEKRTGRLVRILWQKDIDPSDMGDVPEDIENIGVKVDFSFLNFGKRVDIKAPSGSKPIEEILSDIMSTFQPQGIEAPALPEGF